MAENREQQLLQSILDNPHKLGYLVNKKKLTEIHSFWIKFSFYPISYFETNNNLKKMCDFYNSLGRTFDYEGERIYLTEELLYKLLNEKSRSLQGHRDSYKSTAITTIGSIVRLLFLPDERIAIIRKDFTKSSEIIKAISNMMRTPELQELFHIAHGIYPKHVKDADNVLTFSFKTTITPEGNVNAYGVHQDMIGKHFDFIICDDFVTLEDKISKAEREKTKLHIEEIANNILDPGKNILYIGTVWHKEDAWKICPKPLIFDCYTTGLMTEVEIAEKRKKTTNITFMANYELRHGNNDNAMFKNPNFEKWEFNKTAIGHVDKKYFGTDTNALTFCEKKKNGRYAVIGFCFNDNIKDKIDYIKEKHHKYFVGTVYSEDNDDKGFASDLIRKSGIPVITYHESKNKHVKICNHVLENGFWDLIDFDPDTDPEYLNQILDYVQGSEPDDCIDSLACIGRIMIKSSSSAFIDRWNKL